MKQIFGSLVVLLSLSQAHAWGSHGHEMIAVAGSALTSGSGSPFWQANAAGMKQLTTVPDRVWKAPATKVGEAPNHWFQVDAYMSDFSSASVQQFPQNYSTAVAKYTEPTILKNGTAPWRIYQLYTMAVAAFKTGDMKSGLEYAGTMSHYIGDLSQPLHVSENYDGQMTGNTGIHAWFETTNIGDEAAIQPRVQAQAQALLADASFIQQSSTSLMDTLFNEISRSISKRDEVLHNDTTLGRTSSQAQSVQLQLAVDRMADGAATLAIILNQLWLDVGQSPNATPVPISDPSWVTNTYQNQTSFLPPSAALADDCEIQ